MANRLTLLFFTFIFMTHITLAQQVGYVTGRVTNEKGKGIDGVTVAITGTSIGTNTDRKGEYKLEVPGNISVTIVYSYLSYQKQSRSISLIPGQTKEIDITLKAEVTELEGFTKSAERRDQAGVIPLDISKANTIPNTGFGSGVEALIKTYVGSNNELTSQYNVRGGNYDENLVYVNDFEIYRPFLTRSGQQEGMSFVNADLVAGVDFSVGGFQSKYGDKMSSVLDVKYKKPTEFGGRIVASMLGASLALEGASKNQKLTWLFGARHKSNQYLLKSQPTKGIYNPSFTDIQADIVYNISKKWEVELIGNYARNRFNFAPEEQTSSFGLINKAFQLRVFYDGKEIDQFDSRFGGISTTFKPNKKLRLKLLASGFQTNEKETYDILGEYLLGELETDLGKESFGQLKTYLGTGIIHTYARNYLKVNVADVGHRGLYDGGKHFIQWGVGGSVTSIDDKLNEWERRDSAGYTQPFDPNKLELTRVYSSTASFNYIRYTGYLQDNFYFGDSTKLTGSIGARFNYSTLNKELLISPRAHLAYKPNWERDWIFKLAGGLYQQPPFYREMRDLNGV
ncbi:MAG: TonB-dependent receptor, partial [Chitinophagaceae bacterium]|nr:TonB-dependent receptor [Chitinophagaceae bacterium]